MKRELKKGDRVKTTGSWMRSVGLFSDNRIGTVMHVATWKSGSIMVNVHWDNEPDIVIVNAANLRRVGR